MYLLVHLFDVRALPIKFLLQTPPDFTDRIFRWSFHLLTFLFITFLFIHDFLFFLCIPFISVLSDFPFVYHVVSFLNHFSVMSPESLDFVQ